MQVGANYLGDGQCRFTVWAPEKEQITLHLVSPQAQSLPMQKDEEGYFRAVAATPAGSRYFYRLEDKPDKPSFPDPASHCQPEGVHGPSEVIDHGAYRWRDQNWKGIPLKDFILYELHVGTFTPEGTFAAIVPRLDALKETGINAIEIMPISQFPGNRNWGYDGVFPYSIQNSYGTPDDLKRLVDECHARGIAVILDMVYNHLGPEGNYFGHYGPYFTEQYCTPWGDALNFDGQYSDGVRDFFSDNATFWAEYYHLDGLRLDAIHTIYDTGAVHFWEYTRRKVDEQVQKSGRPFYLIAESDLNSPRVIQSPAENGYGFHAQWLDDFHHSLYVLLNERARKRYEDFGEMAQLAKALKEGFVHSGEYVKFRKKKYGRSSAGFSGDHFVIFTHNHDQVGNHPRGQRWGGLLELEQLKLGAAVMLLAPYIPMLFMGEEYGEDNPFYYFVSHDDPQLVEAVRKGRKEEFSGFNWEVEPPDPQAEDTFQQSKLAWQKRQEGKYAIVLAWYRELIRLRRTQPALQNFDKSSIEVRVEQEKLLVMRRRATEQELLCLFNFSDQPLAYSFPPDSGWAKVIDSTDSQWQEPGHEPGTQTRSNTVALQPWSVVVYAPHESAA